jgi:D-alanyl-D-alanine dipeptidase
MQNERIFTWQELAAIPVFDNGEPLVQIESQGHLIGGSVTISLPGAGQVSRPLVARVSLLDRLQQVQRELASKSPHYMLRVVDAHRPLEFQQKAFTSIMNTLHAQFPEESEDTLINRAHLLIAYPPVAGHPTGGAVDVTLVQDGTDVDMGGRIADFSDEERIRVFSNSITPEQRENRWMLRKLMLAHGFAPFDGEWWHFCFGDREWAAYYGEKSASYGPL